MKGMVELPAIAIFTIVAGSLIIMFFVLASHQQSDIGKAHIEEASLERFDSLLKSASTARETASNITIIDDTLLYICDDVSMRIEYESHTQKELPNLLLFAPHKLEGGRLRVYSKGVDVPYRVGNILYVATDAYVINNQTDLPGFPPNFELGDTGFRRTIISYSAVAGTPTNTVAIEDVPGQQYGTIHYYDASGQESIAYYPNRELLYGALLSQDNETYVCVLRQYLAHLHFVNEVEWRRAQHLSTDASISCQPLYQFSAFEDIDDITSHPDTFGFSEAERLSHAEDELAFTNDQLLRGDNCAILY